MRKFFVIFFLSSVCLCAFSAKKEKTSFDAYYKYKVDYVETQGLYRKGIKLTIVTFKLEWPVSLCYSTQPSLQKTLCQEIFGVSSLSLSDGMSNYFNSLGEQIERMPNDTGLYVTYYNCHLKILGWDEGKYLSFHIHKTLRDNLSNEESVNDNMLYTYDLAKHKILKLTDIISSKYNPTRVPAYYENRLALLNRNQEVLLSERSLYNIYNRDENLCSACVIPYGVVISLGNEIYKADGEPVLHALPMEYVKKALAIPVIRILESTPQNAKPLSLENPDVKIVTDPLVSPDTTIVYDVVSQSPQFQQGAASIKKFFIEELHYPAYEKLISKEGKVIVSFVVRRDGRVESPSVIVPCSPGIDREAVRAVMAMPLWTPGSHNGVAVSTRVTLPLNFSLSE